MFEDDPEFTKWELWLIGFFVWSMLIVPAIGAVVLVWAVFRWIF